MIMSDDDIKKQFSKNLQKYMDLRGKTQADIIRDLKFNKGSVSEWVNGVKYPRMGKVQMLADYLGVTVADLVYEHPDDRDYYLNPETRAMIQELYDNKDLRILFDASRNLSPEDVKYVVELVKRLKGETKSIE